MTASPISSATLEKLARYDTPTICNVIELFDVRPHSADGHNLRHGLFARADDREIICIALRHASRRDPRNASG